MNKPIYPYGHFYSPIVDTQDVANRAGKIWQDRNDVLGIDMNAAKHLEILSEWFPQFISEYDYPDFGDPQNPVGFFSQNDQFSWLDSRALFVFLRKIRPNRFVEVGSGFSSLLVADVNSRFHNNECELICIEPYPRDFLRRGFNGLTRLIEQPVQNVAFNEFHRLEKNDVLFIDSSHVAKTGSDVVHLFLTVLPQLKSGVLIHVHDVFLPLEYPKAWVIDQNRSWNEQYLLHALLLFSSRFRVVFGSAYAAQVHGASVVKALAREDGHGMSGGSFWIEVL
jgi:Methyltransferase domain